MTLSITSCSMGLWLVSCFSLYGEDTCTVNEDTVKISCIENLQGYKEQRKLYVLLLSKATSQFRKTIVLRIDASCLTWKKGAFFSLITVI